MASLKIKPYPRLCAECGAYSVNKSHIPYNAKIRHAGKMYDFTIASLEIDRCQNCMEVFFTTTTDSHIELELNNILIQEAQNGC